MYSLSSDPNDLDALASDHFLGGRSLNTQLKPFDEGFIKLSVTSHWNRILAVHNMFWKRWKTEYLTLMQARSKSTRSTNNVQLGTLALIAEDNSPPAQWLLGRMAELHQGEDGCKHDAVTIKTKTGFLKRNVQKICQLPLDD